jgi:hypothetical protein
MHIDLSREEANALREVLQEKVKSLDLEINRTDSLRFKGELRNVERQLEKILGTVSAEAEAGAPKDWEPRDAVTDEP